MVRLKRNDDSNFIFTCDTYFYSRLLHRVHIHMATCATWSLFGKPKLCKIFHALLSTFPIVKYIFIFALLNHNLKTEKKYSLPKRQIHRAIQHNRAEKNRERKERANTNIQAKVGKCNKNHVYLDILNAGALILVENQ